MAARADSSSSSPAKVTEISASAPLKYDAMSSGVSASPSSSAPMLSPRDAEETPSISPICSARSSAMPRVTWDTITRAVPKVVNSSSISVRPWRVSVESGRYSVMSLQTLTQFRENRQNSSAHAYRKKISFRLSTITVASRTKKDGFSVSLRTVSAPSGNPGPITAQGRSGSPPTASGRRPPWSLQ